MDVLGAIKSRRSVREFTEEPVAREIVEAVLDAGRWAPSGLNNQPWKFKVVSDEKLKEKLSSCTKYSRIIKAAPVCIAVFLDKGESYDRIKDVQAIGACIENMLLAAHAMGLGAVWLGEILHQKEKAKEILSAPGSCELMAVLALGRAAGDAGEGLRKSVKDVVL
ncbi:MAG: nitroreductase [Candidatus Altiarchaeota archaeon]